MFRPCIDLHEGKVKQIVGGSLDAESGGVKTNFVSDRGASWYADLYRRDGLAGGHVIMLGPGNETAAEAALAAYPGGLQVGGGINTDNALGWLRAGASHVIVTSWIFREGRLDWERLKALSSAAGRSRVVLDLSCRRSGSEYRVSADRWKTLTDVALSEAIFGKLSAFCAEFLVHAIDVEGLCRGIDEDLVVLLAKDSPLPATYAGGAKSLADLETVNRLGNGRVDLTIGSALDIFGGTGVMYADAVAYNRRMRKA